MNRTRTISPLLLLSVAATATAPLAFAATARASDTVLAPAANTSGITAYAGQVVLSRLDAATGRWALVRYQNGVLSPLPVAERAVPFDADAGPDATGNPVVVYSRCAGEPSVSDAGLSPTPDWETATGCELYELTLTGTPTEHRLTATSAAGESETTPSIWRGNLAFVRHGNGSAVPTIEYLAAGATKPRHLGGGSVQVCQSQGAAKSVCEFEAAHDTVDQLDLGPRRIAYVWNMTGGSVYGVGVAWELRSATLDGGRSTLLDSGVVNGTCGFGLPSGPTASSAAVSYLEAGSPCDTVTTSFATADPITGIRALAATPGGLAAGAVRDANTIYWLRVTGSPADVPVPGAGSCTIADAGCQLVASSAPAYAAQPASRETPPADIDLVESGLGYRWIDGPAGVRLLLPPKTVPCAPSAASALVYLSAQWTRGKHSITVSRHDPNKASQTVAGIDRSLPDGTYNFTRLVACGNSSHFTYAVKTGGATQRVSFTVTRPKASASG
jgi:hypothetical protein